jgi:hypothetical protein
MSAQHYALFLFTLSFFTVAVSEETKTVLSEVNVPSRVAGVKLTTYRNGLGDICVDYPSSYNNEIKEGTWLRSTPNMSTHCSKEMSASLNAKSKSYPLPSKLDGMSAHVDDFDNTYYILTIKD